MAIFRPTAQIGHLNRNSLSGRNGMRQPDVTADHAVIPDNGLTAENRRPGINHHTVANVRMALDRA